MKRNFNLATTLFLVVAFFAVAAPKAMAWEDCDEGQNQPVVSGSGITGNASLCVDEESLHTTLRARNLVPGTAYTVWFGYFEHPGNCKVPNQCGGPDLTSPADNPTGVFGRMDSAVAGSNGRLTFQGNFRGFRAVHGSNVTLFLFIHGAADPTDSRALARQLLTPETPGLGAPGLGFGTRKGFGVAMASFQVE